MASASAVCFRKQLGLQPSEGPNTETPSLPPSANSFGRPSEPWPEEDQAVVLQAGAEGSLDKDGSAQVTMAELSEAVTLLRRRKHAQGGAREFDYSHLPLEAQRVMQQWDADKNGRVDMMELANAAIAWKTQQRSNRMFKRALIASFIVIVLLLISMFGVSMMAAEFAKDMRPDADSNALTTNGGEVVQVSSADYVVGPDGTLRVRGSSQRRLAEAELDASSSDDGRNGSDQQPPSDATVKMALAEEKRQLSSTMPVDAYKNLKSITLENADLGLSFGMTVIGFQRVRVRTSKCGSVVRVETPHGVITIDDYDIFVDDAFRLYTVHAGLGLLLEGNSLKAFGRRLSAAAMLTGFFQSLSETQWRCESQPLERPEELSGRFHLKARMRAAVPRPEDAKSSLFVDLYDDEDPLLLAGVEVVGGEYFKVWEEEAIAGPDLLFTVRRFPMYPMTDFLTARVEDGSYAIHMSLERGVARGCNAIGNTTIQDDIDMEADGDLRRMSEEEGEGELLNETDVEKPHFLEFVDLVEVDGLLLRHFRMHLKEHASDDRLKEMMDEGMVPDTYDYYDVDTDPTGKREAGSPFRRISRSSVPLASIFTEATYESVSRVPENASETDILRLLNVSALSVHCAEALGLDLNTTEDEVVSEPSPDYTAPAVTKLEGIAIFQDALERIPIISPDPGVDVGDINEDDAFPWNPSLVDQPFAEADEAVEHQRAAIAAAGPEEPRFARAMQWRYWRFIIVEEPHDTWTVLKEKLGMINTTATPAKAANQSKPDRRLKAKVDAELEISWEAIKIMFEIEYFRNELGLEIEASIPGGVFEGLKMAAHGSDVRLGCVGKFCAWANAGGELSFSMTSSDGIGAGQEVFIQPSIGGPTSSWFNLPRLSFWRKISAPSERKDNPWLVIRQDWCLDSIGATVSQSVGVDTITGGGAVGNAIRAIVKALPVWGGGQVGLKAYIEPKRIHRHVGWLPDEACGYEWARRRRWSGRRYACRNGISVQQEDRDYKRWDFNIDVFGELYVKYKFFELRRHRICWPNLWWRRRSHYCKHIPIEPRIVEKVAFEWRADMKLLSFSVGR